jgi:hypothetical protein
MATTAKRPAPNPLRAGLRVGGASEPTVFVIYGASGDLSQRKLLPAIYNLAVARPNGELVRLSNLVSLDEARGPAQIDRFARQRKVTVVANLDHLPLGDAVKKVDEIVARMDLPQLYGIRYGNRAKSMAETGSNFVIAFVLSVVFMYMILAAQFESFLHPITIMLALPLTLPQHVILHDGQAASVTVLIAQALEDPLRRVTLLRRPRLIILQHLIDDPDEPVQLRPGRRSAPPVPRRNREHQHLGDRPRVNPKPPRRLATAQPLDPHSMADPSIQLHALHPPALCTLRKGATCRGIFAPAQPNFLAASVRDFVSGAYSLPHRIERWVLPVSQQHPRALDPARRLRPRPRNRLQLRQIRSSDRKLDHSPRCRHHLRLIERIKAQATRLHWPDESHA